MNLQINTADVNHFDVHGFFLIQNPLGADGMAEVDSCQRKVEPEWERRVFPDDCNRLACQFLMVGEPLLVMVEKPELVDTARQLLGTEQVHVGACGLGDASMIVRPDGRQRQVHWHADGGPEVKQVSVRTALDRHGVDNGPLRLLPGSQDRQRLWGLLD
jgi:hypothetical protein